MSEDAASAPKIENQDKNQCLNPNENQGLNPNENPGENQNENQNYFDFVQDLKSRIPIPWVSYALMTVCIVIYLLMGVLQGGWFSPSSDSLLQFGADFGPKTLQGEWRRMLSSAFVHIGLVHIAFNMYVLYDFGPLLERLYGRVVFLLIYVGSALTGALLSLCMNPLQISAGASGAIFGLFGALVVYLLRFRNTIPREFYSKILTDAIWLILLNLAYGFLQPGIDNWAHLGGLAGGILFGTIGVFSCKMGAERRFATAFLQAAALGIVILAVTIPSFFAVRSANLFVIFLSQYYERDEAVVKQLHLLSESKTKDPKELEKIYSSILDASQQLQSLCETVSAESLPEKYRKTYDRLAQIADARAEFAQALIRFAYENDEPAKQNYEDVAKKLDALLNFEPETL